ncbi:AAA family ATPase [bacterium]|nr:AAA family ATPase [bacterium]
MFIKKLKIRNFRLFPTEPQFIADDFNVPDDEHEGSGLTVFVGENGCGKTALIDAIAYSLLPYKADAFSLHDINDPNERVYIELLSSADFKFDGTMPSSVYSGKGFAFEAGLRARTTKSHLSSTVVHDQKYIPSDAGKKPKDNSPDLRVSVNNPFKGPRFSENDVLYLDRNRTFQTRSGTYNSTKFDRLMEDFSYQYVRAIDGECEDVDAKLNDIKRVVGNEFLEKALSRFREISGFKVTLSFIDNWKPFERCFFAEKKDNLHQLPIDKLGSGYEMIFSLLYAFYLSQQSGKQLIVIIDEPELHLHPSLQERFVALLLEFSRTAQIIITTHSPLMVKQILSSEMVKTNVLLRESNEVRVLPVEERLLPYLSANEINCLAFGLATPEYHNELYEELKYLKGDDKGIKKFDIDFFQSEKHEPSDYPMLGQKKTVSLHTFVRNQIHHERDNGKPCERDIRSSVATMRQYLKELS